MVLRRLGRDVIEPAGEAFYRRFSSQGESLAEAVEARRVRRIEKAARGGIVWPEIDDDVLPRIDTVRAGSLRLVVKGWPDG